MPTKILIVEDDRSILLGLEDNLRMEGYETVSAMDGEDGLNKARDEKPELIVLDIMLPKLNGFEVCKKLKNEGNPTPIIILSAMGQETDKVRGLELGADDYVTKPFSPRELMVRVKAVLRRASGAPAKAALDVFKFDNIKIDFRKYQVFRAKGAPASGGREYEEIKMTKGEFTILKILIENLGEPVSRHTILEEIWTGDVTTRTVDTHVWSLREKLEADPKNPKHILTVHRIGYKFI